MKKPKKKEKRFVPFAGDPKSERPTKSETRGEINAIRKYEKTRWQTRGTGTRST